MTRAIVLAAAVVMLPASALPQIQSPGARTLFARSFLYRSGWRVVRPSLLSEGKEATERGPPMRTTRGLLVFAAVGALAPASAMAQVLEARAFIRGLS